MGEPGESDDNSNQNSNAFFQSSGLAAFNAMDEDHFDPPRSGILGAIDEDYFDPLGSGILGAIDEDHFDPPGLAGGNVLAGEGFLNTSGLVGIAEPTGKGYFEPGRTTLSDTADLFNIYSELSKSGQISDSSDPKQNFSVEWGYIDWLNMSFK